MEAIVKCYCDDIIEKLGVGFNECVYENALCSILRHHCINYQSQSIFPIMYDNVCVGNIRTDIIINCNVDQKIIFELKSLSKLSDRDINQARMYKRVTGIDSCILINFNQSTGKIDCVVVD